MAPQNQYIYTIRGFRYLTEILTFQCIACDVMKLCTKFERNRAIGGGVINVFDLMTLNDV